MIPIYSLYICFPYSHLTPNKMMRTTLEAWSLVIRCYRSLTSSKDGWNIGIQDLISCDA